MSHRDSDLRMLRALLEEHLAELSDHEAEAFAGMRFDLTAHDGPGFHQLTEKRREWLTRVHERIVPQYSNLVSRGLVPRGKEVPDPPALQNRPTRPPKPKKVDDE